MLSPRDWGGPVNTRTVHRKVKIPSNGGRCLHYNNHNAYVSRKMPDNVDFQSLLLNTVVPSSD